MFAAATLAAGFGAGLFGHGTLTATMRTAPKDQIGLALGAWGAVQATAAGVAIAAGGVIRDVILAMPGGQSDAALPYLPVFAAEILLLIGALVLLGPRLTARGTAPAQHTAHDVHSDAAT